MGGCPAPAHWGKEKTSKGSDTGSNSRGVRRGDAVQTRPCFDLGKNRKKPGRGPGQKKQGGHKKGSSSVSLYGSRAGVRTSREDT